MPVPSHAVPEPCRSGAVPGVAGSAGVA